jgi:hypothetical protein
LAFSKSLTAIFATTFLSLNILIYFIKIDILKASRNSNFVFF